MSNDSSDDILYLDCRKNWPDIFCAFGNVCGLVSTGIFFVVYLPQIYRNFRFRTVQGLSPYWIIANFTAAINNLFFVFKYGNLPLYTLIGGCYSPVVHGTLLCQIFIFTPYSRNKLILSFVCIVVWIAIALLQTLLSVYDIMQWFSVILWSVAGYPQVLLNMKRQSTQGLSTLMIALRAGSICLWFFSTYLLELPVQTYTLCFFSGSGGFLLALQIIYFWKQPPRTSGDHLVSSKSTANIIKEEEIAGDKCKEFKGPVEILDSAQDIEATSISKKPSKSCNIIRICLSIVPSCFLVAMIVAFTWSLHSLIALVAPIILYMFLTVFHFYFSLSYTNSQRLAMKVKHFFKVKDNLYTVKI